MVLGVGRNRVQYPSLRTDLIRSSSGAKITHSKKEPQCKTSRLRPQAAPWWTRHDVTSLKQRVELVGSEALFS